MVRVPTHITIGEADISLIKGAHFFAMHIPYCEFTILQGLVTHMTLLNEGTFEGKKSNPEYVCDDLSINRTLIHENIGKLALEFFSKHL